MPDKVADQRLAAVAVTETGAEPACALGPTHRQPIESPSSDGKPMAESQEQARTMTYACQALELHFGEDGDTSIAIDLPAYYVEGEPKKRVAPDVMVVHGVPSRRRGSCRVWEEGKAPDFVLEVLSDSTNAKDESDKRKEYAAMGVREYFLYDPLGRSMVSAKGGSTLEGETSSGWDLPRDSPLAGWEHPQRGAWLGPASEAAGAGAGLARTTLPDSGDGQGPANSAGSALGAHRVESTGASRSGGPTQVGAQNC